MYWQQTTQNAHFNDANDTHNDLSSHHSRLAFTLLHFFVFVRVKGCSLCVGSCCTFCTDTEQAQQQKKNEGRNHTQFLLIFNSTQHKRNRTCMPLEWHRSKIVHQQCNNAILCVAPTMLHASQPSQPLPIFNAAHVAATYWCEFNPLLKSQGEMWNALDAILQSLICYRYTALHHPFANCHVPSKMLLWPLLWCFVVYHSHSNFCVHAFCTAVCVCVRNQIINSIWCNRKIIILNGKYCHNSFNTFDWHWHVKMSTCNTAYVPLSGMH